MNRSPARSASSTRSSSRGQEYEALREIGERDLSCSFECGVRVRVNLFCQQDAVSAAVRLLADGIPALELLGLPPVAQEFAEYRSGIVLVTGETGSGKSTTLAALLDRINHTRPEHIITLEDPIEYVSHPRLLHREPAADRHGYPQLRQQAGAPSCAKTRT